VTTADEDPGLSSTVDLCALLSMPEHLRIVRGLLDGERTFDELLTRTGISQPELLAHLNTLCRGGLLVWRHQGVDVLYALAGIKPSLLAQCLASLGGTNFWGGGPTPPLPWPDLNT
jgi:DNA-binding HxlR family transcriptional regulator